MQRLHRRLPRTQWLVLVGVILVAVTAGTVGMIAMRGAPFAAVSTPIPTPTLTPTVTPTPSPLPTATPQPTATPRPRPTATPQPSVPNQNANYLKVYIDYSYAGCHLGNGSKRPFPLLYFTNTFPNDRYVMTWGGSITNTGQFFMHGDEGANIVGGHTETVEILPLYGTTLPLTIQVDTWKYPYSDVPGHWRGTVQPCP